MEESEDEETGNCGTISDPCSYSNGIHVASDLWLTQRDVQPTEQALSERDMRRKRLQKRSTQILAVHNHEHEHVVKSTPIPTVNDYNCFSLPKLTNFELSFIRTARTKLASSHAGTTS